MQWPFPYSAQLNDRDIIKTGVYLSLSCIGTDKFEEVKLLSKQI